MTELSDFQRGLLLGILIGEGHFGGDGKQPHVTLRMHTRHQRHGLPVSHRRGLQLLGQRVVLRGVEGGHLRLPLRTPFNPPEGLEPLRGLGPPGRFPFLLFWPRIGGPSPPPPRSPRPRRG